MDSESFPRESTVSRPNLEQLAVEAFVMYFRSLAFNAIDNDSQSSSSATVSVSPRLKRALAALLLVATAWQKKRMRRALRDALLAAARLLLNGKEDKEELLVVTLAPGETNIIPRVAAVDAEDREQEIVARVTNKVLSREDQLHLAELASQGKDIGVPYVGDTDDWKALVTRLRSR